MQILQQPRLIHEQEDVHLLETFLFSTKMNEANFRVSQQFGHTLAKNAIGKDFYAIPERIFLPIEEGRGGHTANGTKEEEYKEIQDNSLGKIVSVSEPHYFNDGTGDYWYDAKVKLNGSKTASVLIENGSKTFPPFSVSQHIWPLQGNDDNITGAEFMGLGLVITGAEGNQAVVKKYCTGGAVNCQKSLAAAVQDVINSFNTKDNTSSIMSTQLENKPSQTFTVDQTIPQQRTIELPKVNEEVKKEVTLTKEEYDTIQKTLKENEDYKNKVIELENENKTNILNQILKEVTDENVRKTLFDKYFVKDVKLVKEVTDDVIAQILPSRIEAAVKEAKEKDVKNVTDKGTSRTASSLKEEPKKEKKDEESLTASVTNEPTVSEFMGVMGL